MFIYIIFERSFMQNFFSFNYIKANRIGYIYQNP